MMNGFGWTGWLFGSVLMVGFWVLIFWLVVSVIRRPESQPTTRTALDILSERFARGEIDADEYTRRRDALGRTETTHV
jgi:putative membrane protein